MNRIIMMDRRNRVAVVEPGVTFSKLQPELAKEGLRLSMPLLPRTSKSVLASVLEREPIMNPRYAWSLSEPLRCLETVMGNGDVFRTGELAGAGVSTSTSGLAKFMPLEELLEKRRKTQETALYQYGPGQFNYHKLLSAAQGTMGIVTWASLRCEVLPKVQKFFLVPANGLESIINFAYKLLRIRFHEELLLLNGSNLAFIKLSLFHIERILRTLLLLSGILISYNTGANELATIVGPAIHSGLISRTPASLIGSLFVFLGAVLLSKRVIENIGKGITTLDPYSGFAAQFGAGICVLFFTSLGMPISTTYCIIGGISGVGMSKGMKTVRIDLIKKIIANWFLAPSLAFLISYSIMKIIP